MKTDTGVLNRKKNRNPSFFFFVKNPEILDGHDESEGPGATGRSEKIPDAVLDISILVPLFMEWILRRIQSPTVQLGHGHVKVAIIWVTMVSISGC